MPTTTFSSWSSLPGAHYPIIFPLDHPNLSFPEKSSLHAMSLPSNATTTFLVPPATFLSWPSPSRCTHLDFFPPRPYLSFLKKPSLPTIPSPSWSLMPRSRAGCHLPISHYLPDAFHHLPDATTTFLVLAATFSSGSSPSQCLLLPSRANCRFPSAHHHLPSSRHLPGAHHYLLDARRLLLKPAPPPTS